MASENNHLCRILLVDDDQTLLNLWADLPRAEGYRVATATTYGEAKQLLEHPEELIDLLIADLVLDVGNGFALARAALRYRPRLKTLFVTGFDMPADQALGPVLLKPVSNEELVAAAGTALTPATECGQVHSHRRPGSVPA